MFCAQHLGTTCGRTRRTRTAPRRATAPRAPWRRVPAKRSSTVKPGDRAQRVEDGFAHHLAGRPDRGPGGTRRRRLRRAPATMRTELRRPGRAFLRRPASPSLRQRPQGAGRVGDPLSHRAVIPLQPGDLRPNRSSAASSSTQTSLRREPPSPMAARPAPPERPPVERLAASARASSSSARSRSSDATCRSPSPDCRSPNSCPSPRASRSASASANPSLVRAKSASRSRAASSSSPVGRKQYDSARAPAHPAAQLVQLRQPEAPGAQDDHDGGVGHVHPHLDDRGAHQHVGLAGGVVGHGRGLLGRPAAGRAAAAAGSRPAHPRRAPRTSAGPRPPPGRRSPR